MGQTAVRFGTGGVTVQGLPDWEGWSFTVQVRPTAPPSARAVTVTPPADQAVTAEVWRRLPIGTVLRLATSSEQESLVVALTTADTAGPDTRPYGGSPEHTSEVVRLYRTALGQGLNPRDVIARRYDVTPKTVSRWLAEIRDAGELDSYAAERRRATESPRTTVKPRRKNR